MSLSQPLGALPAALEDDHGPDLRSLLRRYDQPGPRYTSYPTAVEFHGGFDESAYRQRLAAAATSTDPLSLYVHLPFCEARCSYCGCMVIATQRREVAARYLEYLEREIAAIGALMGDRRRVVQHHWGGGTPTYLSPRQIRQLHEAILRHFELDPNGEQAIEIDPRVTTREQLDLLRQLGFNRLSLGVQDLTPEVQKAIGRHQSVELTREVYTYARRIGFPSINVDLVYGLPRQSMDTFRRTLEAVIEMRPDRVATYSYAHVPWLRPNQKQIDASDLPDAALKLDLFGAAVEAFLGGGYEPIGIDHFALAGDELATAAARGALHRNFMGYTTRPAPDMLGVGVSAISDVGGAFSQNVKKLTPYYAALEAGRLPVERGYALDADDLIRRHVITQLMCNFRVQRAQVEARFDVDFDRYFRRELEALSGPGGPVADGFLTLTAEELAVTARGRLFVRNICMAFDRYLPAHAGRPAFSKTV
jgi:oxygen-independent coproporphyrinogen III oxidase